MTLKEIAIGQSAQILEVGGEGALRQHFLDMGVLPGAEVTVVKLAPMGDPMELEIHGYELTLRLDDAAKITEAAAFEPMMGSMAFSMVMVRTAEGADSKAVAEAMKSGIDPRKWICVEADDLKVAGFGDVVMLIMVNSDGGMTAQSFVDAFAKVAGFEAAFVI